MSQLEKRIARIEDLNGFADQEIAYPFGCDVLIQDFEIVEAEDGEPLEVLKGDVRRLFVMDPNYQPKSGERVIGFEPVTITNAEFKSVHAAILNTSRSI